MVELSRPPLGRPRRRDARKPQSRLGQNEARSLGEVQPSGRNETARGIARPGHLAGVLDITAVHQPIQIANRCSHGHKALDLHGELPRIGLHVPGIIMGFGQLHDRTLTRTASPTPLVLDELPLSCTKHFFRSLLISENSSVFSLDHYMDITRSVMRRKGETYPAETNAQLELPRRSCRLCGQGPRVRKTLPLLMRVDA